MSCSVCTSVASWPAAFICWDCVVGEMRDYRFESTWGSRISAYLSVFGHALGYYFLHTHINALTCMPIHKYVRSHKWTRLSELGTHARIHMHAHAHKYMHTNIYTHSHTVLDSGCCGLHWGRFMRLAPSCPVCLRLDTLVSTPNLNSAHRETGGGDGGLWEGGRLKERSKGVEGGVREDWNR